MPPRPQRPPLNVEAIIAAAAAIADRNGITGVTMRNLGKELGVEAMSLYHHVANKDALLDGLVEWIAAQLAVVNIHGEWRNEMITRAHVARSVFSTHPWSLGLLESRRVPSPSLLRHHDAVLGSLRNNGFSIELAVHAFSALDSYVFGFVLTEMNLPFDSGDDPEAFVDSFEPMIDLAQFRYLSEMIGAQVRGRSYAYADEFEFGLTLILDGLQERLANGS